MLFILILLYIQTIYSYNVTINSNNIHNRCILNRRNNTISKTELMKQNVYQSNEYYCKKNTDICVIITKFYDAPYVNFPDEDGNFKTYISKSCSYNNNLSKCKDGKEYTIPETGESVFCSYRCSKDSDCLHNKCMFTNQKDLSEINTSLPGSFDKPNNTTNTSIGYCVFNEDSPATHCDTIYNSYFYGYFEQSYVHCGKSYSDNCTIDDECSSEYCNTHCILNSKEPSYDSAKSIINPIIILIIISIYI